MCARLAERAAAAARRQRFQIELRILRSLRVGRRDRCTIQESTMESEMESHTAVGPVFEYFGPLEIVPESDVLLKRTRRYGSHRKENANLDTL